MVPLGTNEQDGRGTLASAVETIPGGSFIVWFLAALLLVNVAHFAYSVAKSWRKKESDDPRAAVYAGNHYGAYPGERKEKVAHSGPRRDSHAAMMQQSPLTTQTRPSAGSENGGASSGVRSNGFGAAGE